MARVKLEVPAVFHFSTTIEVRIGDINYGGHLGNDALLGIIHEARLRFLKSFGWSELDIAGTGLIMADAAIVFKAEAFYGDHLQVDIAVTNITKAGFDLFYRVFRPRDTREIARVKTGLLFFDYQKRKLAPTPVEFRNHWQKAGEVGIGSIEDADGISILEAPWMQYQEPLSMIRHLVFVQEQKVPVNIELDEHDCEATHVLALADGEKPVGTARMLECGKIGRVAILKEYRRLGIGARLMNRLMEIARSQGLKKVYLHSQESVMGFYTKMGFVKKGERFFEAEIPHFLMERAI